MAAASRGSGARLDEARVAVPIANLEGRRVPSGDELPGFVDFVPLPLDTQRTLDHEFLIYAAILIPLIGGTALIIGLVRRADRRQLRRWQQWAATVGLVAKDQGGGVAVDGLFNNCPVRIRVPSHGSQSSDARGLSTSVEVLLRQPLGMGLRISKKGFAGQLGGMLGVHDIQVGDPAFDDVALVRGQVPGAVAALLTPPIRAWLIHLLRGPEFRLVDAGCRVSLPERTAPESAYPYLNDMSQLCTLIEETRAGM